METKFQTSFIPKKPILSDSSLKTRSSISIFMLLSVLIFIVSLAGAGFVVFWKGVLIKTQTGYGQTLTKNESQFDLQTINTLRRVNTKIDIAKQLLANHLAVTQIFGIMGALTAQNTRFNNLDFTAPSTGSTDNLAHVTMSGVAVDFSSIAFQSDVLGSSSKYGRNIVLKNPSLTGLSLNGNGNVSFVLSADIDASNLSYKSYLASSLGSSNSAGTSDSSVPASAPVASSTNSNNPNE